MSVDETRALTEAEAVIRKVAEVATAVGWQANEPASELAGQIISILAAHPEKIGRFMDEGAELFIDGSFAPTNGSLTYRATNGRIMSPAELRAARGHHVQ